MIGNRTADPGNRATGSVGPDTVRNHPPSRLFSWARFLVKGPAFAATVLCVCLDYWLRGGTRPEKRRAWMHRSARRLAWSLGLKIQVSGPVPRGGLLVCNHVSYLDIVALASITPMVFVSKADVRAWPVFGQLASWAGTVYVRRESRSDVSRVRELIQEQLRNGELVTLFPEGTSSDGSTVLPFRSSLLEPAVGSGATPAWIGYTLAHGSVAQEVAYWGDMTLAPHLLRLLTRPAIGCQIVFGNRPLAGHDRKELAQQLQAEVARLGETCPGKQE